jgi:hypothetical protein
VVHNTGVTVGEENGLMIWTDEAGCEGLLAVLDHVTVLKLQDRV